MDGYCPYLHSAYRLWLINRAAVLLYGIEFKVTFQSANPIPVAQRSYLACVSRIIDNDMLQLSIHFNTPFNIHVHG